MASPNCHFQPGFVSDSPDVHFNYHDKKLQTEFTESVVFLWVDGAIEIRQTDIVMCAHSWFSKFTAYSTYILYYFLWLTSFKISPTRLSLKKLLKSILQLSSLEIQCVNMNVLIQRNVQIQKFINPIVIFVGVKDIDTHGQTILRDNWTNSLISLVTEGYLVIC